ncbi:MAG: hypothetical protein JSW07_14305, partial [bacterium]
RKMILTADAINLQKTPKQVDSKKLLKQLAENYHRAKQELEECDKELESLRNRGSSIDSKLPQLREAVERAKARKANLMDEYCYGKASQAQVETVQADVQKSEQVVKNSEELLNAVTQKIYQAESEIGQLHDKVNHAKSLVWNMLSNEINEDLQKEIGEKVAFAFVANLQRLKPLSYNNFVDQLFSKPSHDEIKSFSTKLNDIFENAIK